MFKTLRGLLRFSFVYNSFAAIIGADRFRRRIVEEFIQPKKGERILDIGCGPGSIFSYFPDGVHYVGFDLSEEYVEAAVKSYGHKGTFFAGDVETVELNPYAPFDKILAIGVLHHLSDEQVTIMMKKVMAALRPGGALITLDGCFTKPQNPLARRIIAADRGEYVRTLEQYQRLVEPFGQIQTTLLTDGLRIPYTHLIMNISKV